MNLLAPIIHGNMNMIIWLYCHLLYLWDNNCHSTIRLYFR